MPGLLAPAVFLTKGEKFGMIWAMGFVETIKKLWKPFVLVFLLLLIVFNWQEFCLFFNYKFIYGKLKNLTEDSPRSKVAEDGPLPTLSKGKSGREQFSAKIEKEDSIVIPKIKIEAPIVLAESDQTQNLKKYLKDGVLLYPTSVLPGEQGRTVLLGHSAPEVWPDINYDNVFNHLNQLIQGDQIYVYFNQRQYVYSVKSIYFLGRGQELPQERLTNTQSVLILLSCWPPGKDEYRIAVEAVKSP